MFFLFSFFFLLSFPSLLFSFPLFLGYTENVTEVTGSVKFFNCDGLQDLGMFASLAKLGGSFEVKVRLF